MPENKPTEDLQKTLNEKKIEAYNAERQASFYRMVADSLHQEISAMEQEISLAKGANGAT